MEDFEVMQLFESFDHLYKDMPDVVLAKAFGELLLFGYFS